MAGSARCTDCFDVLEVCNDCGWTWCHTCEGMHICNDPPEHEIEFEEADDGDET